MLATLLFIFFSSTAVSAASAGDGCDVHEVVQNLFEQKPYQVYIKKIGKIKDPEVQAYYKMANYTGNRFMTKADAAAIADLYARTDLSGAEKAAQSFEVYLNARMKSLLPKEQEALKKIVKNVYREYSANQVFGHSNRLSGLVTLSLPEAYYDTMLNYGLLAHELEHSIQKIRLSAGKSEDFMPKILIRPHFNRTFEYSSFMSEVGSMKAEAEYLNAIPAAEKAALLNRIQAQPEQELKRLGKYFLGDSHSSVEDYVARQWNLGRNAKMKFLKKNFMVIAAENIPFLGLAGTGTFVTYHFYNRFCVRPTKPTPLAQENRTIKNLYCSP